MREQLKKATGVVTETFKDGLQEKVSSGQIGDIVSLFGKGGASSSMASGLSGSLVSSLGSKLGLSEGISKKIADYAIPFIINQFSSFAAKKGKDNKEGISDLLGDLVTGSVKDKLLGGLGKKFGF
jgi:hypothetical protein